MAHIITVRLLDAPFRADRDYDYILEEAAENEPLFGRLVTVPFGAGNRGKHAVITAQRTGESEQPLKTALSLLPADFCVTPEILRLCFFLREHTLCSVGEAVRAAAPCAALGLLTFSYAGTLDAREGADREAMAQRVLSCRAAAKADALAAYLSAFPHQTEEMLEERFGKTVERTLALLVKDGRVTKTIVRRAEQQAKTERIYRVCADAEAAKELLRRPDAFSNERQRAIYTFLAEEGACAEREILDRTDASVSPLQTLVRRGLVACEKRTVERNPYEALARKRDTSAVVLSRAQTEAYEKLSSLLDARRAACALLHGVTGSGKTRVMMKLIDRTLAQGRQAVLMVPEIALTPQTVGIFCARYGERVSVLHSSLSVGERFDAYRKILRGDADLVIGTRSAVFAPLKDPGLFIIDEEHEHTYKSDAAPRYHTRDIAAYRSGVHGALTLLASATPTIESYYKAETGKYTLISLTERYGNAMLPKTEIVDMREELRTGNTSPISRRLEEELKNVRENGKQAVLFLNRRGYHHAISCKNCGEPLLCEHCSVSLTYHTGYTGGYLLCHACGTRRAMPKTCPSCSSEHLSYVGAGTQKAEAEIKSAALGLRVLRMDADTTGSKSAYERILGRFRQREADVLLGTQMVTRGHDFPDVTLSGVLLADSTLYMNDFRAAERTFAQLTQVIGRAGRSDAGGYAVIQTFSPMHRVITLAAAQDYPAFYREELAWRRAMRYPPFCDMAEIFLSGENENLLLTGAKEARDALVAVFREKQDSVPAEIYGPLEPQNYKIAERFRMKLLVKCRLTSCVWRMFGDFLTAFCAAHPKLTVTVDFNPSNT